jgi:hypothetical protein
VSSCSATTPRNRPLWGLGETPLAIRDRRVSGVRPGIRAEPGRRFFVVPAPRISRSRPDRPDPWPAGRYGRNSPADVGFPTALYANTASFVETGPESGPNGYFNYTPTANQG